MPKKTARRKKEKEKKDPEDIRRKLKLKHIEAKNAFKKKYPHLEKYLKGKGIDPFDIRERSARIIGTGILAGTLMLSSPSGSSALPSPTEILEKYKILGEKDLKEDEVSKQKRMVKILKSVLPEKPRPLTRDEEKLIEQVIDQLTGVKTKASLEGEHLNTTYGYVGAEQHLIRHPQDSLDGHGEGDVLSEGIAPGLGAWGYFANSKDELTEDLIENERWYVAVQTLYLPDWNVRHHYLKDWYKYRKIMMINTENGKAVIGSVADSGPAVWTGKHFGGSPEIMDYLGGKSYKKGAVIVFFVDDPDNKIPLGPVEYN